MSDQPRISTPKQSETPESTPTAKRRRASRLRWLALAAAALPATLIALLIAADLLVSVSVATDVADSIESAPVTPVALILGTARTHRGRPNRFYHARMETAAALFHSGKVRGILVSGDNSTRYYNEPVAMQKDLMALGVPPEFITLDYAGFRTLDSMVRAKEVFGLDRILVVSQRFHAERAIFLARHFGLDATGVAAADPDDRGLMKVRAREVLARFVAVIDLATGRGPKFLGVPETVRLREADVPTKSVRAHGGAPLTADSTRAAAGRIAADDSLR
jgi:SanA protein